MPAGIVLTGDELDALAGLPFAAQVLYLAIRRRMDFATGYAGVRPRLSWNALGEMLEVEPHQGIARARLHRESVRRAAGWLVRRGLIEFRAPYQLADQLVFFCPMAQRSKSRPKKADTNPTWKPTGETDRPTEGKPTDADRKPTGGVPEKPTYIGDSVATSNNRRRHNNLSTSDAAAAVLVYEKELPEPIRQRLAWWVQTDILDATSAQLVADELAGVIRQGRAKNPSGLLQTLADQAQAGTLVGSNADAVRQARQARQRAIAAVQAAEARPAAVVDPEAISRLPTRLRKVLNRGTE